MKPANTLYAIVHFLDRGEVDIVPCAWLCGDMCTWPSLPTRTVEKMIKKGVPPGDNCTEIPVSVKGVFVGWNAARKMLPRAVDNSDLNDADELPAKRVRRPKVIDSDDDFPPVPCTFQSQSRTGRGTTAGVSGDTDRQQLEGGEPLTTHATSNCGDESSNIPPPVSLNHRTRDIRIVDVASEPSPPPSSSWSQYSATAVNSAPVSASQSRSSSCCSDTVPLPGDGPAPLASERGFEAGASLRRAHAAPGHAMPEHEFQLQVLRSLNVIRLAVQQQSDLLSQLTPPSRDPVGDVQQLVAQPFSRIEDFEQFESTLTPALEKQFVQELTLLGGATPKAAVKRILEYVMTDQVAEKYSWEGRKGKNVFRDLRLPNIMMRAVHAQKQLSKCTNYDLEKATKDWLRHSADRLKRVAD
ncbi:uncharacterized protein LOC135372052 isoform X2 [Ornithodoros turicata]|uniref:uncharacterized protein LOC135372052 isoform X2 n=1 Tax=Ornithodoros turicata TaxID=34597 RepID=UPI00313A2FB8